MRYLSNSFDMNDTWAIIYFSNKSNSPNKAKMACHAALWGIGLGIVLQIIATVAGAGN